MGTPDHPRSALRSAAPPRVLGGDEDLEVVGEADHQDALWAICAGSRGDRVRHEVVAVLVPEHDPAAIAVRIEGDAIGYLPRAVAERYAAPLGELMAETGAPIALRGVIVGGGHHGGRPRGLGVWLDHDPADFGAARARPAPRPLAARTRSGSTGAWRDADPHDLPWRTALPDADLPAIAMLRSLLADETDPLGRHFQFVELQKRLHRVRDLHAAAPAEFDEACARHDAEMAVIRAAFMAERGKVPVLETYRQMVVRQQERKDWAACLWWADRGLAAYGGDAAREDAVDDLLKRRARALAKLDG